MQLGQPWLKPEAVNKAVECFVSTAERQILHVKTPLESISCVYSDKNL